MLYEHLLVHVWTMDTFFVSRGTKFSNIVNPALLTLVICALPILPCLNHVLIVDIVHCSSIDRFLLVNTVAKYCGMFDFDKKSVSFSTFHSCTEAI